MRLNNWILAILLMFICSSCIEHYEPKIQETSKVIVIDGMITDTPGIQSISVSWSSPYNNPQFQPITGCVVRVEDEKGNGRTYSENGKGIYESDLESDFLAVGKAYKLLVFTPEGKAYESEYDSLLACAPIDHLSYKLEMQGTTNPEVNYYGIRFYVDMKGGPENSRNYMWTYEESWEYLSYYPIQYIWDGRVLQDYTPQLHGFKICYLESRLKDFQVGSSGQREINEIGQQPLHFVSNQTPRLQEKFSLLVTQHSLSYEAFQYWNKMRAQTGDTGGLFETQPSNTRGSIYNIDDPEEKVLGYFFATQVKEKRITVSDDFEFPISSFNCPLDTTDNFEEFSIHYPYIMYSVSLLGMGPPYAYSFQECHDCTYRGGITTKPEYWDD